MKACIAARRLRSVFCRIGRGKTNSNCVFLCVTNLPFSTMYFLLHIKQYATWNAAVERPPFTITQITRSPTSKSEMWEYLEPSDTPPCLYQIHLMRKVWIRCFNFGGGGGSGGAGPWALSLEPSRSGNGGKTKGWILVLPSRLRDSSEHAQSTGSDSESEVWRK